MSARSVRRSMTSLSPTNAVVATCRSLSWRTRSPACLCAQVVRPEPGVEAGDCFAKSSVTLCAAASCELAATGGETVTRDRCQQHEPDGHLAERFIVLPPRRA